MRRDDRRRPPDLHEPVQAVPLQVTAQAFPGEPERMLRKFVKKVRQEGILQDFVIASRFVKKAEARRAKRIRSRKAARRQ